MTRALSARALRRAAVAAALVTVAGCSSSGGTSTEKTPTGSAAELADIVCAKDAAAKKVDVPASFPKNFPLPPGTIVYSADDRGPSTGVVITGVTSTPFKDVLKALQHKLPAAGFTPDEGETEPHDAESNWTAKGYDGRWAIREIPQCAGDTLVNVVARHK